MSRRLRFLPPDALVEVTTRTLQGRFLLQPNPRIADLCRGVLARAARVYPVRVHAFAFLSNHYHLLLTAPDAQRLAAFMNYLNSNLAREVGRAVSWRERFWGRRYQAIPVSAEESAQVERLVYLLRQGCKEGLVRRPGDWPGATSLGSLLTGEAIVGTWIDHTLEYASTRNGHRFDPRTWTSTERLELAPLPCWASVSPMEYRRRIEALVSQIEVESSRALKASGREELGVTRLRQQDPHRAPNRIKRSPAPLIHAATRSVRLAHRAAYRAFVAAFRTASEQFRRSPNARERFSLFPERSFPPPGPFVVVA